MKQPIISVIIPAYNYASSLDGAVGSIRSQRLVGVQIIIINDCSSDNTDLVVQSLLDDDIVYLKNDVNLGVYKTINKGLKAATGQFICILDADDEFTPDSLRHRYEILQDGVLDAVHAGTTVVDGNRQLFVRPLNTNTTALIIDFLQHGSDEFGINNATFMYHSRVFALIGYFDETNEFFPHSDFEFTLRVLLNLRVGILDTSVYTYKRHSKSHSDLYGTNNKAANNQQALKSKYIELFKTKNQNNYKSNKLSSP